MKDYELVVLLHPDLEIDLDRPLGKVEQIVTSNGGTIVKKDNWGKRKLAYPIRKENFAVYVLLLVQLPAEGVKKVNDTLNITDEVLRFLLTVVDPKAEAAKVEAAEREARREEANSEKTQQDDTEE